MKAKGQADTIDRETRRCFDEKHQCGCLGQENFRSGAHWRTIRQRLSTLFCEEPSWTGVPVWRGDICRRRIRRRQALWDDGYPLDRGLGAGMFDAAQEELFFEQDALGADGRRAEARFIKLNPLQQVAYKHLVSLRSGDVAEPDYGLESLVAFAPRTRCPRYFTRSRSSRAGERGADVAPYENRGPRSRLGRNATTPRQESF